MNDALYLWFVTAAAISFSCCVVQVDLLGDDVDYFNINVNSKEILFETDEKFLSVALDISFMRCFFHKFSDSDWKKLKELSSLLSPAYLRLGGTDADRTIFILNGGPVQEFPKNTSCKAVSSPKTITITGKDWIKLNKFSQSAGLNLIIDLNVLLRRNSQWDSLNAKELIRFSEKNNFSLAFELGNEPNSFPHVFNKTLTGTQLAKDYYELKKILNSTTAYRKSKLIGPEVTRPKNLQGSSVKFLTQFLAKGAVVDVVSWHQYYLNGRTATLADFINPETLDLLPPQIGAISEVVRQYSPDTPIWISETSSAYGGGAPKLSNRFVASFLWLDKLGMAARLNMSVVIRQSLFKDHYALINDDLTPTPVRKVFSMDFWISVLYKNLVGNRVLGVELSEDKVPTFLRIYCHCLSSSASLSGSIVIYAMNLSNRTALITPLGLSVLYPIHSFIFEPEFHDLKAESVLLNGQRLIYSQRVVKDMLEKAKKVKFPLRIPPKSIAFWVLKEIAETGCRRKHGELIPVMVSEERIFKFVNSARGSIEVNKNVVVMGLLTEGSPLSWEETHALADHVREHGITQFINLYHKLKDRQGDFLKWGDEVEYMIVKFDNDKKTAKLSLRAQEILPILQEAETNNPDSVKSLWRPEYAAYMIEGTPGKPYGGLLSFFNTVETNMKLRREEASAFLKPGEVLMSLTSFPRLGCPDFTDPAAKPTPKDGASKSLFFPDAAIYPGHPRFKTLTRNIRMRRTEKIAINMPIFKDENTPSPFVEDFAALGDDGESARAGLPDHVYMDAMGFGMGCCCLQLTFQACNIQEARTLYDQLTPLCPIMLALTAASPFYRGKVSDVDCRWNVISGSVDCRTPEERGLVPLKNNRFIIPKSRYDSIDSYLSEHGRHYNDVPLIYDDAIYKRLRDADIDDLLAQHIAHLFIRDSVSLFSERVHQNDNEDSDHFENIQSTNWQTMRFKPPPFNSSIGWRVEFRPCEVQITDMENAAIVCFVVLLTRVILSYQLNFIIPISKVDENMQKAQRRNALREQLFWFRKDILTCVSPPEAASRCQNPSGDIYELMSINHIINGKEGVFPGLIPLINSYLSGMDVDADTHCTIQQYLKLIQRRASGELKTTAAYLRDFVSNHPEYKKDSVITERINYDLLSHVKDIEKGKIVAPELLGISIKSKTQEFIPEAVSKAYESNYSNATGTQMSVSFPQS